MESYKEKTAVQNMPVVSGFKSKMELPVILVSENMVKKVIEGEVISSIDACVNKWKSLIP